MGDIHQPVEFTPEERKAHDLMKQMVLGFVRVHHPEKVLWLLGISPGAWSMGGDTIRFGHVLNDRELKRSRQGV